MIGAGYLGGEILRRFRAAGWEGVGVTLSGGEGCLACDVGDRSQVEALPDTDALVHCAASGRGGEEAYRNVYVAGCRNLSGRFPGARWIYTSSSSVYGQTGGEKVDEMAGTLPDRATGRLLLEAEGIVLGAGGVVARLAGIYGPGRSVLLRKFLSGDAVVEEGGGRFLNMIHRDDAARAVLHLMSRAKFPAGEIFNVADTDTLTQKEIYEGLAEKFGMVMPPGGERDPNRKRGWTNKIVSNKKLRATGWEPVFPGFLEAVDGLMKGKR